MKLELFAFDLPKELIAQHPVRPRDSARLLVVPRRGAFREARVRDLPALLREGDLLVVNDTRVLPVRFRARREDARIEVTLLRPLADDSWQALAKGARKLRAGDRLRLAEGLEAEVMERGEGGRLVLRFALSGEALRRAIRESGEMPLPPYIRRSEPDVRDRDDYQTLFARREGSVAAPTAGLHFTPELLRALEERGIATARVTLHVGLGTFQPIRSAEVERHRMHPEWCELPAATCEAIRRTRARGGRVVAVGTTVVRTLESFAQPDGTVCAGCKETDLYITPGFRFRVVDLLLTNFHLPRSTLFVLVCAFAGFRRMHEAYRHAIARRFRFFSYGDATLLERQEGLDLPEAS